MLELHSKSGVLPKVTQNITWFRNESNKLGSDFGQMDYHYFLIQMLYLVEYADYDSQAQLGLGISKYRMNSNDKALVIENNTDRIIVSTSTADYFDIGQPINIGVASAYSYNVAANRSITKKEAYSSNGITGTAIYFDGSKVNIVADSVIGSASTVSGQNDTLGMKSGTLNNDGKHSVIYRGMEDIYGKVYQWIDGINIKDNVAYVSTNMKDYALDKFDGSYHALGYTNATASGNIKILGYDSNNPLFAFTLETGVFVITDSYESDVGNINIFMGGDRCGNAGNGLWRMHIKYNGSSRHATVGSRLIKLD